MARSLRGELQARDPVLYSAFERSAEIALRQWLPSIPEIKDSYNSYPHILGVEYHIDDILYRENAPEHIIKLNSTEIYVLLCAVLLHDIGKAIGQNGDHAAKSEEIVIKNWAVLGIVSMRIAMVIAHVCRFHDCDNQAYLDAFSDIDNIDRFEPIRTRKLGALLLLADKLDNTFSRVVPSYLKMANNSEMQVVGKFRSKTQSVLVDYSAKMVITVIDKEGFEKRDLDGREPEIVEGALFDYLNGYLGDYMGEKNDSSPLFTIVRDVYNNNKALEKIHYDLYAMHIPLNAWMIECDNHLYRVILNGKTYSTAEALEPIINYEYCRDVLVGILLLSGTSFGKSFHTYEKLLRYVKEDANNLYKIEYAVRRLSIILKGNKRSQTSITIYHDNVGWQITKLKVNGESKMDMWVNENDVKSIYQELETILKREVL